MKEEDFKNARRLQQSILTPLEKKTLHWLASGLPRWVKPDHLTSLGFLGMIMVGASYALSAQNPSYLFLAGLFLIVNWFGDSLDGTVARLRNIQRPRYGFYVDHIVDCFGAVFLTLGLIISGYISIIPAVLALVVFLLLSIHTYLATYVNGVFKLSAGMLGPTELRVILIGINIWIFYNPTILISGHRFLFFDVAGYVLAILMAMVLLFGVVQTTINLYNEERV